MAELEPRPGPRQYLSILRRHVLEPVLTAESIAERERTEVADERDALEAFADRVEAIAPVSPRPPALRAGSVATEAVGSQTETLRREYEETVLAVPHYDDEYAESVAENAVAEFGPELGSLLSTTSRTSFTESHKGALVAAVSQRASERDEFCDRVDAEMRSLASVRHDLTRVLDDLDTSIVPVWYRDQFEEQVGEILRTRQSTLGARSTASYHDRHSLCAYLYPDEPWTYPALTAVARLLDSVSVRGTSDDQA